MICHVKDILGVTLNLTQAKCLLIKTVQSTCVRCQMRTTLALAYDSMQDENFGHQDVTTHVPSYMSEAIRKLLRWAKCASKCQILTYSDKHPLTKWQRRFQHIPLFWQHGLFLLLQLILFIFSKVWCTLMLQIILIWWKNKIFLSLWNKSELSTTKSIHTSSSNK